jgi:hypothetical protein
LINRQIEQQSSNQLLKRPLCVTVIAGVGLRMGPLLSKFKRVEMELLHLFKTTFLGLHSLARVGPTPRPPLLSRYAPRALTVHDARERAGEREGETHRKKERERK